VGADLVGLTEIWDGNDQERIRNELRDVYPYSAVSPAAAGIGRVIEKTYGDWPRVARMLFGSSQGGAEDGVVSVFTRRHYSVGKTGLVTGRNALVSEDLIGQAISSLLRSAPVWGAGLVFLSKYPIESSFFLRHPLKADWERMADKGVLWSTVKLPNGRRVRVCLGIIRKGKPHRPWRRAATRSGGRADGGFPRRSRARAGRPQCGGGDLGARLDALHTDVDRRRQGADLPGPESLSKEIKRPRESKSRIPPPGLRPPYGGLDGGRIGRAPDSFQAREDIPFPTTTPFLRVFRFNPLRKLATRFMGLR
jgi:hypothetical protein